MNHQDGPMTGEQILAMVTCMLSTAKIDGIRPEEVALIRKFYADSTENSAMPDFESLLATNSEVAKIGLLTPNVAFSEQMVLLCLMTGYCDGSFSDAERAHVNMLAGEAGVSQERVDALTLQVKDSLIGSLAHLPDSESVAALAKTL